MALSDEFKRAISAYQPVIEHDNLIHFKEKRHSEHFLTSYDFLKGCMITSFYKSDKSYQYGWGMTSSINTVPFKDLDRKQLENIREYMIANGKNPLPLPEPAIPNNPFLQKDFTQG